MAGGSGFPDHDAGQIGRDRTYVKVDGALTYNAWCEGLRDGRSYISDGMSHLMEFSINNVPLGQNHSEVPLDQPGLVHVAVKATAWLDASPRPVPDQERRSPSDWRLEWARIGSTREVPFELLVNGAPAFHTNLVADGRLYSLAFEVEVPHSSWIAARILPSSHTNPMWVQIAGQPLRPDRRSAAWCLQVVEQSWARLQPTLQPEEAAAAKRAYDHARQVYARLQSEN